MQIIKHVTIRQYLYSYSFVIHRGEKRKFSIVNSIRLCFPCQYKDWWFSRREEKLFSRLVWQNSLADSFFLYFACGNSCKWKRMARCRKPLFLLSARHMAYGLPCIWDSIQFEPSRVFFPRCSKYTLLLLLMTRCQVRDNFSSRFTMKFTIFGIPQALKLFSFFLLSCREYLTIQIIHKKPSTDHRGIS